jgi:hypothetical protein
MQLSFEQIQRLSPNPYYTTDVTLSLLPENLERLLSLGLNLDPDYQRGHVWTKDQKVRWGEYLLKGGIHRNELVFNHPGWMRTYRGPFEIVDGKQRLAACMEFLDNQIPVFANTLGQKFGFLAKDIDPVAISRAFVRIQVNTLQTRAEVLRWYLEINQGITPHQATELTKVQALLDLELSKTAA